MTELRSSYGGPDGCTVPLGRLGTQSLDTLDKEDASINCDNVRKSRRQVFCPSTGRSALLHSWLHCSTSSAAERKSQCCVTRLRDRLFDTTAQLWYLNKPAVQWPLIAVGLISVVVRRLSWASRWHIVMLR